MLTVLISMLALTVFLSIGGPLPFCFGLSLMVMHFIGGVSMKGMLMYGLEQITSPVLLSIPLFVFAGGLMGESGIAKSLLDFVNIFVGKIKGGLGVVTVVTCAIIGAISGSSLTGVAALAPIMVPRMAEEGYPRGFAAALVSISSVLGLLIPPSISMITYGWVTGTSILACFLATLGPGLLITTALSVLNLFMVRNMDLKVGNKTLLSEKLVMARKTIWGAAPALMMPVIILGGIYGGIMTATEAAGVAAVYAIPVGFLIYRGLKKGNFFETAVTSASTVGSIMLMIMLCLSLGQTFVMLQVPKILSEGILSITSNKYLVLLLINVIFAIMGMLVSDMVSLLLVVPLLFPLVLSLGVNPVHFAAIVGVNLGMGVVTPPYASVLYLGIRLGKTTFQDTIKPLMILLIFGYVPVLALTTYVPELSLFIPRLFGLL
ncbi:MAG: TRAP transporter large permease [Synergistales bacterium]